MKGVNKRIKMIVQISLISIILLILIFGSYILFIDEEEIEHRDSHFYYKYRIRINTNVSDNFSIIVPALIYTDQWSSITSHKEEYLQKMVYHRMNEIEITSGKNTKFEIVNTSKGYGLKISSTGNVTLVLNMSEPEGPDTFEASMTILSTTVNKTNIEGQNYECWVNFQNDSQVDSLNISLYFLSDWYYGGYHGGTGGIRTIQVEATLNSYGWIVLPGEYRYLNIG